MRAANALEQAQMAEAPSLAPYEYTRAREYFRKAREEAGESSFESAAEYGRLCTAMAEQAREKALASGGPAELKDRAPAAPATGEPGR